MPHAPRSVFVVAALALLPSAGSAGEFDLNGKRFRLADGLTIELAAAGPLTERPICVDFDDQGRLYVAESSGTNDNVQQQLAEKPHSILRLKDTDGDGVFDKRNVFADRMMFPEGCEWHDGSLYVGAPPQIWKLTDADDDGVAERREVWFDGMTLTGCANDMHGPYAGPDGILYWCKGAFAEQTHAQSTAPFVTKASHIFRHDPQGFVEPVLTGGMDNPVEVAFTRDGEPILSCTFLQHPANGLRDGLIHAVYGGVWGKTHGVLDGHPRTGDLMPPLVHLGAAAPAGLTRLEHAGWGSDETLLACSFNMHKVTRHVLRPAGGTYETIDDDLVVCDDPDFHPTDILEDADGSLLLVDTGGWYKLCCPTSQLHKPDVTGAIYRIRRTDASSPTSDPRGLELTWDVPPAELAGRLDDERFEVRRRAISALAGSKVDPVPALVELLKRTNAPHARQAAAWALTRLPQPAARAAIRELIVNEQDTTTQRIAIKSAGLWRDVDAASAIEPMLKSDDRHTARVAAEALGRIGDGSAVPALLALAGRVDADRFTHHAATYALIEIGDSTQSRAGLESESAGTVRAALLALDQGNRDPLHAADVISRLDQPELRSTAIFILEHRPEWDDVIAAALAERLSRANVTEAGVRDLVQLAARFAQRPAVRDMIATLVRTGERPQAQRSGLLAMKEAKLATLPKEWTAALIETLSRPDTAELPLAVAVASNAETLDGDRDGLVAALASFASSEGPDHAARLHALRVSSADRSLLPATLEFVLARLDSNVPVTERSLAVDVLRSAKLSSEQLQTLAEACQTLGPLELDRVLEVFANMSDPAIGRSLAGALKGNDATEAIVPDKLRATFANFDPETRAAAASFLERTQDDSQRRAARLEELLGLATSGDVRRGQAVFLSSKAACSSCHMMGYLGGNVGPDLTRIGQIRNERDLLEAIVYPSASFVRSYEPMTLVTMTGQVHSGVLRDQTDASVTLATAAEKTITIDRDEIEDMRPGTVSIMPAGLNTQLTPQELADLVAFLRNAK